jgi:hypothetical protein
MKKKPTASGKIAAAVKSRVKAAKRLVKRAKERLKLSRKAVKQAKLAVKLARKGAVEGTRALKAAQTAVSVAKPAVKPRRHAKPATAHRTARKAKAGSKTPVPTGKRRVRSVPVARSRTTVAASGIAARGAKRSLRRAPKRSAIADTAVPATPVALPESAAPAPKSSTES